MAGHRLQQVASQRSHFVLLLRWGEGCGHTCPGPWCSLGHLGPKWGGCQCRSLGCQTDEVSALQKVASAH